MLSMVKVNSFASLPVIADVDLVVVEGGLSGLSAAVKASEMGKRVLILEPSTLMGYEMTSWQRPWISKAAAGEELALRWFPVDHATALSHKDDIALPMDKLKKKLEDVLLEAGVEFIYGCRPVSLEYDQGKWVIVIGSKSGRQVVTTMCIYDTSENNTAYWLKTKEPKGIGGSGLKSPINIWRTLEFTGVAEGVLSEVPMPKDMGVENDRVYIYQGALGKDHVYVDIPLYMENRELGSLQEDMRIEAFARKRSLDVAAFLVKEVEQFTSAKLGFGSLRVRKIADFDPIESLRKGEEAADSFWRQEYNEENSLFHCYPLSTNDGVEKKPAEQETLNIIEAVLKEESEFSVYGDFVKKDIVLKELPLLDQVDVLVAGGGTSGATAARVAGEQGMKTLLLEMNSALGGSGTLGGVHIYWFGLDSKYTKEINDRVEAYSRRLRFPQGFLAWNDSDIWSIEIKSNVLLDMCLEAGVSVFFNCMLVGTLMQGNEVIGAVAATPYGPTAVIGKITIDATGDGDVAAFAGARHIYGNERDRMTMAATLTQYKKPGEMHGSFTSTVDVGNLFDYTRFILASRRRGGEIHDHASYLAPRESRHIEGETTVTLGDLMLMRRFEDTILICYSNHDPKGKSSADILHFGLMPPHLEIEVPYRAIVPKDIDQLLVVGKAYSCTHDALPAIRMQRDLQQLGGVSAVAAAMAVEKGTTVRKLPVSELQDRLIKEDALDPVIRERKMKDEALNHGEIINGLTGEEPFDQLEMGYTEKADEPSPIAVLCYADPGKVVPGLLSAHANSTAKRRLLISKLLVWHGIEEGLEDVLESIRKDFQESSSLPVRKGSIRFSKTPPDHAVMPETAYMLYTIARVRSKRSLELYEWVVERLSRIEKDYENIRPGIFHYIESVAYAAERLVYPEFIPLLKKLLLLPELQGQVRSEGFQVDIIGERQAYLVLSLYRALARCGLKEGLTGLAEFLKDNRAILAASARDELASITGNRGCRTYSDWIRYLENYPDSFEPKKWDVSID